MDKLTICSEDVLNHLTKLGYTDAVNEINKLLNKDKTLHSRNMLYFNRVTEFAKNFGVWDIQRSINDIELEFEEYGDCPHLEELAKNVNGRYYEYDEYDCAQYDLNESNTIVVDRSWFELMMHLWINKYSDYDYDIYQSKLI